MLDSRASSFVRDRLKGVSLIETPMDDRCRVSVVVPIYNEPVHRVVNLMLSLARQRGVSDGTLEILCVVNNGPDDGSKEWKIAELSNRLILDLPFWRNRDSFGAHLRFPVEVLDACREVRDTVEAYVVETSLHGKGLVGEALNRALAETAVRFDRADKNGLVIFFGADNIVDDPDYLTKALQMFKKDSKLVAVSGGVRLLFDPDTRDVAEQTAILELLERFLRRKRKNFLERFLQGQELGLMSKDAFIGSNILARSRDAAAWGGFPDWKQHEDSEFGYSAKRYAQAEGLHVVDAKDTLVITSALRDSDRTGYSLKDQLKKEQTLEPVSASQYEELEQKVGATKEGRALIDLVSEPANILWDNYPN